MQSVTDDARDNTARAQSVTEAWRVCGESGEGIGQLAEKLSETKLKALAEGEVARDGAVKGFGAVGTATGASFFFDYRLAGRRRYKVFGEWHPTPGGMKVEEARARAMGYRIAVREGIDPFALPSPAEAAPTWSEAVDEYHRRYLVGERQAATADEIRAKLRRHGAPWSELTLDAIGPVEIAALLDDIRDGDPESETPPRPGAANNVHALLSTFFAWAARPSIGYVDRSPMDGVPKPAERRPSEPRPSPPEELGRLWRAARALGPYEGAYLRVLLLCGKRSGQKSRGLASMRRDEIGEDGWWRPADAALPEAGATKLHMPIPLSGPALRIIRRLPAVPGNPYVFAGDAEARPLYPGSKLLARIQAAAEAPAWTYHHVRDTVCSTLEEIGVPGNVARRLTDHAQSSDAHQRAYTAADLAEAVEDAAEIWGRYVLLCARERTWAKAADHLSAADVPEGEARRRQRRERRRAFNASIQAGGRAWRAWVAAVRWPPANSGKAARAPGRPALRVIAGGAA